MYSNCCGDSHWWIDGREEISGSSQDVQRLKQIQKLAEKKLEELPENRTSFSVGGKRIIIRESIQKAIRTITQFKALISGAVSAEPHAALAWACILGVLPVSSRQLYCCL